MVRPVHIMELCYPPGFLQRDIQGNVLGFFLRWSGDICHDFCIHLPSHKRDIGKIPLLVLQYFDYWWGEKPKF